MERECPRARIHGANIVFRIDCQPTGAVVDDVGRAEAASEFRELGHVRVEPSEQQSAVDLVQADNWPQVEIR